MQAYYVVEVVAVLPSAQTAVGETLGLFETREEAEYFISLSDRIRACFGCSLAIREASWANR